MNRNPESETTVSGIGTDLEEIGSMKVLATVTAIGEEGNIITVQTPTPGIFTINTGETLVNEQIVKVPLSEFSAYGISGPVPVYVSVPGMITRPSATTYVRVILTNAIITADPQLRIMAMIQAVDTDGIVTLVTPDGNLPVRPEGPMPMVAPVYSIPTSAFTASHDGVDVPIIWHTPSITPSGMYVTITALTCAVD